jgi:hypothetical protein
MTGLDDKHINVRLAAAGQLSVNPPATAQGEIAQKLRQCEEDNICEMLVLGLGRLPGEVSIAAVTETAQNNPVLADAARLALSKLGHKGSLQTQLNLLSADNGFSRYQGLVDLIYIADANLAVYAKPSMPSR